MGKTPPRGRRRSTRLEPADALRQFEREVASLFSDEGFDQGGRPAGDFGGQGGLVEGSARFRVPDQPTLQTLGCPDVDPRAIREWPLADAIRASFWVERIARARVFCNQPNQHKALTSFTAQLQETLSQLVATAPAGIWEDPDFAALHAGLDAVKWGLTPLLSKGRREDPQHASAFVVPRMKKTGVSRLEPRNVAASILLEWGLLPSALALLVNAWGLIDDGADQETMTNRLRASRKAPHNLEWAREIVGDLRTGPPSPREFIGGIRSDAEVTAIRQYIADAVVSQLESRTVFPGRDEVTLYVEHVRSGDTRTALLLASILIRLHLGRELEILDLIPRVQASPGAQEETHGPLGAAWSYEGIGLVACTHLASRYHRRPSEIPQGFDLLCTILEEWGDLTALRLALGVLAAQQDAT